MITLKTLRAESIPSALEKAGQYRLLNEPHDAESICEDILAVSPHHQEASIIMLLALTDQFTHELGPAFQKAMDTAGRLDAPYDRHYYTGIINERRAKAHLRQGGPGAGPIVYSWLAKAMTSYEQALEQSDPDDQDAILRWNSCARLINTRPEVRPSEDDQREMLLDSYQMPH